MKPDAIKGPMQEAGLTNVSVPTCSVAGKPVENGLRNLWVTATALSTAMNTAYFAEQVALFSIVTGIALLLTGIGFLVLTFGLARRLAPAEQHSAAT